MTEQLVLNKIILGKGEEKPGGQKLIPEYGMQAVSSPGLACWDYHVTPRACAKARNNDARILFIPSMVSAELTDRVSLCPKDTGPMEGLVFHR